jgi:cytochrome P450
MAAPRNSEFKTMQASSAADPGVGTHAIPEHVPRELIRSFDFRTGLGPYPHESVAALHAGPRIFFSPTHHNAIPGPGTWVLTRAEDIRAALQDATTFSSNVRRSNFGLSLIPLELDPPEHPKFRAIMNPIFSPVRMKQLEGKVRGLARDLVARIADKGGCDFVEDFAKPFPVGIFLDLMGLPQESMGRFLAWEARIMRDKQTRTDAIREVAEYLQELISARRRNPTDDLITFAVKAQVDNRPLADAEIIGICVLLFIAGLDTVTNSFSFHFRHLAEHPADQEALRKDAALIPSAVEELFRAYAVVNTNRYTTRDVEFAGVTMKRGDNVTCSTILASRDPSEFPNPNEVIFSRSPNLHNAFSYGPHRCLGSHLARREISAGIEEWIRSIPPFRVKPGAKITAHGGGVFSLDSLPLVW